MARDATGQLTNGFGREEVSVGALRSKLSAVTRRPRYSVPERIRVLLIEDDPGYTALVRQLLAARASASLAHITLADAVRLSQGLSRLDNEHVDVVLLDLGLPDSDGLRTLARVREQARGVPVVVLTGAADERLALEALQKGAQDYLIKTDTDGEKLFRSIRYAIERQRLLETLENLSLIDELTGLYNRRGFFVLAGRQFAMAKRRGTEVVLVLADVDGLKQINDRYGHQEGDRALVLVSEYLRRVCREADVVGRLGGDEFAVLLAEADLQSATHVVVRLREKLNQYNRRRTVRTRVSLSVGLAASGPGARRSLRRLIAEADADMYRQKKGGRKPRPGSK